MNSFSCSAVSCGGRPPQPPYFAFVSVCCVLCFSARRRRMLDKRTALRKVQFQHVTENNNSIIRQTLHHHALTTNDAHTNKHTHACRCTDTHATQAPPKSCMFAFLRSSPFWLFGRHRCDAHAIMLACSVCGDCVVTLCLGGLDVNASKTVPTQRAASPQTGRRKRRADGRTVVMGGGCWDGVVWCFCVWP